MAWRVVANWGESERYISLQVQQYLSCYINFVYMMLIYFIFQGVGGNPECKNVTRDDGSIVLEPVSEQPRFSAQVSLIIIWQV